MYVPRISQPCQRQRLADQNEKVFLNVVLDEAVEEKAGGERVRLGMVVCL